MSRMRGKTLKFIVFKARANPLVIGFLFVAALCLLSLNLVGLNKSMRNPAIYTEPLVFFDEDITLSPEAALEQIVRRPFEPDAVYVHRLTKVINQAIAHYWYDEGLDKYHLRVPIWENYLLWLSSYISPISDKKYEFYDYQRAVERGVGYCSQHAIAEGLILEEFEIESDLIDLNGHIILRVQVDHEWWIADPDYGVVIPHDLPALENDRKLIENYYPPYLANYISDLYTSTDDNVVMARVRDYGYGKYHLEKLFYLGIWVLPLLFTLPGLALLIESRTAFTNGNHKKNFSYDPFNHSGTGMK